MKPVLSAIMLATAVAALAALSARADEGMFTMESAAAWPVETMKKGGLAIAPDELLARKRAVAKVGLGGGGGTGSFVSDEGLLVTNHHVAYGCLAALDGTAEHKGIMANGFVAPDKAAEIPCPGYAILAVEEVRDITAGIRSAVSPRLKAHRRFEALRIAKNRMEKACEAEGKGYICEADSLDGGRSYHMMVYLRIRDVRLVYAPEEDIGKYGGDVDNWMYPRHTGDFSFLRAYVDKTGGGAALSTDNVPYRPPVHLTVSSEGVSKGSFVSVLGFPARTKRNFPAASARFETKAAMPLRERVYKGLIEAVAAAGKADELTARRYQGLDAGLNNALKYYRESAAGFAKWDVLARRSEREKRISQSLQGDPARGKRFSDTVLEIEGIYKRYEQAFSAYFLVNAIARFTDATRIAFDVARWTEERRKPDEQRKDAEYKDKNVYQIFEAADRLEDEMTPAGERAVLVYLLEQAEGLPRGARLRSADRLVAWGKKELARVRREADQVKLNAADYYRQLTGFALTDNPVATAVELVLARTLLVAHGTSDAERERALFDRRRLFFNDPRLAAKTRDPLLDFARGLAQEKKRIEDGPYRSVEERFDTELRPAYASLIGATYPDANFQVRMTFGAVDDYTAAADGKTHRYLTDGAGILAKDKGAYPFRVPPALRTALEAADKGRFADKAIDDVPVNFTATLDTTGGNSGSPVLDARGRLVGLLFDGTPESILSDWQFLPDNQRSICLDVRYLLFLAEQVHGAKHIVSELGL